MLQIEEIRQMLRRHLPRLREEFHVDVLGVFGSYVRGEQTENSDLDVLVNFSRTPTLFEISRLQEYLEAALGLSVDVIPRDGLKEYVAPEVLHEVQYV